MTKISPEAAKALRQAGQGLVKPLDSSAFSGANVVETGVRNGVHTLRNLDTGKVFKRKAGANGMLAIGIGDPDFWPGVRRAFFGKKK